MKKIVAKKGTPVPTHLAVDPGNEQSGWVCFQIDQKSPGGIHILGRGKTVNVQLRRQIVQDLLNQHGTLIIEMPKAQGMPEKNEIFETCLQVGRFLQVWGGKNWTLIHRSEVKLHICGSSRAKDPNVRAALIDHFGGEQVAVGGKKCPKCHGKGWHGRERQACAQCLQFPGWVYPPGPLAGFAADMWAALALAVFWADQQLMRHRLTASLDSVRMNRKPKKHKISKAIPKE